MAVPIIQDITVRTAIVPIDPPHRTASGLVDKSPLVLIDVLCSSGLVGHGLIFTYMPAALKPVGDLISGLKPLIIDQSLAPATLYDKLQARCRLIGPQGLMGMALAGIDMALWDALAQHQSLPLCRLLGGDPGSVKAYAGIGYDGEMGTAEQAEKWAKKGFQCVKAKIGYPTVEEDVRVVRAMRAAVGVDIDIMVDYNQCLHPEEAIVRLRHLDGEGLIWVEEPVLAHDFANSARVKDAVDTAVQSGENWWGPTDMRNALDADASDYVMPDIMKIGGVTGWQKAVALADAAGKQVSSHLWPEISAQLLSIGRTSHWLEYIDWWAAILQDPLQVEGGIVVTDDTLIGTGVGWNEKTLHRYLV